MAPGGGVNKFTSKVSYSNIRQLVWKRRLHPAGATPRHPPLCEFGRAPPFSPSDTQDPHIRTSMKSLVVTVSKPSTRFCPSRISDPWLIKRCWPRVIRRPEMQFKVYRPVHIPPCIQPPTSWGARVLSSFDLAAPRHTTVNYSTEPQTTAATNPTWSWIVLGERTSYTNAALALM